MHKLTFSDVEGLFESVERNRSYLSRWLPWLDFHKTIEDTMRFVADSMRQMEAGNSLLYVIEDDDVFCGLCGFTSINKEIRAGYLGYWLDQRAQGRGLITKACRRLETIGFDELGLNKIEIHVAINNPASIAVAERLGYQQTGTLLDAEWLYDHFVDHYVYCKRNPDRKL